jgi:hypothetical protein
MTTTDYPIDVRADRPERSSRGWAALTILLIKFVALIPHFIVLSLLSLAQIVVAFVAQVAVVFKGEYPAGMFDFVAGVLRWSTRVGTFALSLNDQYPPFSMEPDDDYPADLVIERPARSSRVYALFTVLVQVLFVALIIGLIIWITSKPYWWSSTTPSGNANTHFSSPSYGTGGLFLRELAALPHLVVLFFVALAAIFIWMIVQWAILFRAVYPQGMFDFVAGFVRWQARVSGYTLGLSDRYPPFSLEPSITLTAYVPARPSVLPPATGPSLPPPLPTGYATPSPVEPATDAEEPPEAADADEPEAPQA